MEPNAGRRTLVTKLKVERCNIGDSSSKRPAGRKELLEVTTKVDGEGKSTSPAEEVYLQLYERRLWGKTRVPSYSITLTQDNFCGIDVCKRTLALLYKTGAEKIECLVLKSSSRSGVSMNELKNTLLECLLAAEQIYEHIEMCPHGKSNLYILRKRVIVCSLMEKPDVYPICRWDHSTESLKYSYYQGGADNVNVFKVSREQKALIKTMTLIQSEKIHTTFQKFLSEVLVTTQPKDSVRSDPGSLVQKLSLISKDVDIGERKIKDNGEISNPEPEKIATEPQDQSCCCDACVRCSGIPSGMTLNNKNYVNTREYENMKVLNHEIAFSPPKIPPRPVPEKTYKRDYPLNQLTDTQVLMLKVAERQENYKDSLTFEELHDVSRLLSLRCPLGKDWRRLVEFPQLGLKFIDDIENIAAKTDILPGYLVLSLWFQLRPRECTRQKLKEVLIDMGRHDIVTRVFNDDKFKRGDDGEDELGDTWELYL
ncbi:uncharacterized protein LOC144435738 [Glandiceps talaboti]